MIFTSKKNGIQTMETREDFYSGTPRILPALRILVQLVKLSDHKNSDLESVEQCWQRGTSDRLNNVSCLTKLTIYLQIYCDVS